MRWRRIGEQRKRTYTGKLTYQKQSAVEYGLIGRKPENDGEESEPMCVFFCPFCMKLFPFLERDVPEGYGVEWQCTRCKGISLFEHRDGGLTMIPMF